MADVIDALIAEALGEGPEGLAAVAHVIATRAAQTGMTPEEVVNQAGQFAGVSNPGRIVAQSMKDPEVRAQVQNIWDGVNNGSIPNPYPGADFFHTPQVSPSWSNAYTKLGQTGDHIFYTSGAPDRAPKQAPIPMSPTMRPSTTALAAIAEVAPGAGGDDWLRYTNSGATRSQPLSDKLTNALSFLNDMGVTMEVFSGGQPSAGNGPRVGSTRHDHGDAGDVFFYQNGRQLDWADPKDRPIFEEIVRQGKIAGLTGFGAGEGYMRPGSMHIGFGAPGVWGAGGKSANAPDWLRAAYYGSPSAPKVPLGPIAQASPAPKPPRAGIGGLWANLPQGIGGLLTSATQAVQGAKPGLTGAMLGTVAGRTAIMNALMPSNIGAAPTVVSGYVPGGTQAVALSANGALPVTLMGSGNARSQAFDNSVHSGQNMDIYRANRESVGGPITQSSIEKTLSSGGSLYKRH